MDYKSVIITLVILLIGFGLGYLAKPAQVYKEVYHVPTAITLSTITTTVPWYVVTKTLTVETTATTTVVISKPEVYLYEHPEGIEVKIAVEEISMSQRIKVYITNRRNETVHNFFVLVNGYNNIFGWGLRYDYIDMVEPNTTRLSVIDILIPYSRYYIMVVALD